MNFLFLHDNLLFSVVDDPFSIKNRVQVTLICQSILCIVYISSTGPFKILSNDPFKNIIRASGVPQVVGSRHNTGYIAVVKALFSIQK